LLDEEKIEYRYREYRQDPLSAEEIRNVLRKLGLRAADVLRTRDRAFKELDLSGDEPEDELIARMAEHPTLLQRPIGIQGNRAVVGRPPEKLLELSSLKD
jgi:arsenate reductase